MSGHHPERPRVLVRALVSVLLLVFSLSAADPTPRFLGLPRAPRPAARLTTPVPGSGRIKPVLPRFDLPDGVLSKTTELSSSVPRVAVARVGASRPRETANASLSGVLERVLAPSFSGRNGSGPPLRC